MNSIPQNLRNVIKNRIKTLISPIFYNMVDFSVDNLFSNYDSGKHFFYVDSAFALPKYDHYDPIVKAIAISNASNSSQSASARSTSAFMNFISQKYNFDYINNICLLGDGKTSPEYTALHALAHSY